MTNAAAEWAKAYCVLDGRRLCIYLLDERIIGEELPPPKYSFDLHSGNWSLAVGESCIIDISFSEHQSAKCVLVSLYFGAVSLYPFHRLLQFLGLSVCSWWRQLSRQSLVGWRHSTLWQISVTIDNETFKFLDLFVKQFLRPNLRLSWLFYLTLC